MRELGMTATALARKLAFSQLVVSKATAGEKRLQNAAG
jgi:hypothetical protein